MIKVDANSSRAGLGTKSLSADRVLQLTIACGCHFLRGRHALARDISTLFSDFRSARCVTGQVTPRRDLFPAEKFSARRDTVTHDDPFGLTTVRLQFAVVT